MMRRNRPVDASVRRYALVWAGVNVFERESERERERESAKGEPNHRCSKICRQTSVILNVSKRSGRKIRKVSS